MARTLCAWTVAVISALVPTAVAAQVKPRIVAVNYALQYFTERLVGDHAEVVFPVPAGVDPAFWRPAISDISMIQGADLIVLNGAGFATWVDRVSLPRSRLVNTSAAIEDQFIVTERINHTHGDGGEHSHESLASSTWLDPMLAMAQADAIAAALIRRGLIDAEELASNLQGLRSDLAALNEEIELALSGAESLPVVTTHPRYAYVARRYGLKAYALDWDAGAMPSPDQLSRLRTLMETNGAKILIWEAVPPRVALAATVDLGLTNVIFEPLAQTPVQQPFIESIERAAQGLAEALRGQTQI